MYAASLKKKLRTPEIHFSFEDKASQYGFSVRKKIIFDDSSPSKEADAGDSDDAAVDLEDGAVVDLADGAAVDQSSKEVDVPSTSSGNPKKRVLQKNDDFPSGEMFLNSCLI